MKKKKVITVTHIDNCSHGYYSISKKDVELLGIVDQISGCSGLTLTRAYLEEDCDAALIHEKISKMGIKFKNKHCYNEQCKIIHINRETILRGEP